MEWAGAALYRATRPRAALSGNQAAGAVYLSTESVKKGVYYVRTGPSTSAGVIGTVRGGEVRNTLNLNDRRKFPTTGKSAMSARPRGPEKAVIKGASAAHPKGKARRGSQREANGMAKAGMRRPDPSEPHGTESNKKQHFEKNTVKPVPEIQGKGKTGKKKLPPA